MDDLNNPDFTIQHQKVKQIKHRRSNKRYKRGHGHDHKHRHGHGHGHGHGHKKASSLNHSGDGDLNDRVMGDSPYKTTNEKYRTSRNNATNQTEGGGVNNAGAKLPNITNRRNVSAKPMHHSGSTKHISTRDNRDIKESVNRGHISAIDGRFYWVI